MNTSALSQLSEKLSDNQSVQKIIELTMHQGLTPDDPQLYDLLKEINFIESLQIAQKQEFEAIVKTAIAAQSPSIQTAELTEIVKAALAEREHPSIQTEQLESIVKSVFAAGIQPSPSSLPTILAMLIGVIIGISVTGALAHFYLIPLTITERRGNDRDTLQYLESREGQFFKQMVRLNKGYLDTKQCQIDAAKFKVQLNRNGQKVENVCLIEVPRSY